MRRTGTMLGLMAVVAMLGIAARAAAAIFDGQAGEPRGDASAATGTGDGASAEILFGHLGLHGDVSEGWVCAGGWSEHRRV